ncbi:MAG TPA: isoaspartyl peptidase/L-asparaginase [Chitinophagaceae bacterium]|nr:isoaspartyl peptidase/L-asparaginase [Chitinophagaceae bacterium]
MKKLFLVAALFVLNKTFSQSPIKKMKDKFVLVIHGGAGTILKSQMTPDKEKAYTDALNRALQIGNEILKKGGTALDAVEACVRSMEDDPLFNAGKGAVFNNEGKNELDAAIMDGRTLAAGSVAGLTTVRNPISAARAVMEKSPHVMMIGAGAEKFAKQQGLEIVDPSYFYTESRWKGLQKAKAEDSIKLKAVDSMKRSGVKQPENKDYKYGTVGAVALDRHGNLAAATSSGGMTNKKFGRVGDVPIIGAGTYANNATVAISCTGWGEFFIRLVMAKSISDMMEFGRRSLKQASDEMIMKRLPALGGDGGLIAVDKDGNFSMPFNSEGMYRGYINNTGKTEVKIYKE